MKKTAVFTAAFFVCGGDEEDRGRSLIHKGKLLLRVARVTRSVNTLLEGCSLLHGYPPAGAVGLLVQL